MHNKVFLVITILTILTGSAIAKPAADPLQYAVTAHYNAFNRQEYFSGIAAAIYQPGKPVKTYFIGKVSHEPDAAPITAETLFQIGSITKSFTAAILLQLEKENKLKMTSNFQSILPGYENWFPRNLNSLLNMTNGLPNYTDSAVLNASLYAKPDRVWKNEELIALVYPPKNFRPPLRYGYNYTNTSYILSAMIIEKLTGHSIQQEYQDRLLKPLNLQNTFYPLPSLPAEAQARLAHGYGYNPYSNAELVGVDVSRTNLSWAGAAGAMISNTADIITWVKALVVEDNILDKSQKRKLMSLISTESGQPISKTTVNDPRGFGLGVSQGYEEGVGTFWYYEGQTDGFRATYMYSPKTGIIIVCLFNSSVNGENDHAGDLVSGLYLLVTQKK